MIIKAIKIMPRLLTIPELDAKAYRQLQAGEAVDVPDKSGQYLIDRKFAEAAISEEVES